MWNLWNFLVIIIKVDCAEVDGLQDEFHYHAVSQNATLQRNKMEDENFVNVLETRHDKW